MARYADDASRWSAVVAREPAADGAFVYCVKTTKIYCRPICKARLARQANVEFHVLSEDAERAGFRACKRCRPDLNTFTPEADKIRKICDLMRNAPNGAPLPRLESLAKEVGLTKCHFHRLFKKEVGITPKEFALVCRIDSTTQPDLSASIDDSIHASVSEMPTPDLTNTWTTSTTSPMTDAYLENMSDMECAVLGPEGVGKHALSNLDPLAELPHGYNPHFLAQANNDPSTCNPMKEIDPEPSNSNESIIAYATRQTLYGLLLVAFQDGQICKLDLGETETELITNLENRYPAWLHTCVRAESHTTNTTSEMDERIDVIVEALERPTGKVMDLHLDPYLFGDIAQA